MSESTTTLAKDNNQNATSNSVEEETVSSERSLINIESVLNNYDSVVILITNSNPRILGKSNKFAFNKDVKLYYGICIEGLSDQSFDDNSEDPNCKTLNESTKIANIYTISSETPERRSSDNNKNALNFLNTTGKSIFCGGIRGNTKREFLRKLNGEIRTIIGNNEESSSFTSGFGNKLQFASMQEASTQFIFGFKKNTDGTIDADGVTQYVPASTTIKNASSKIEQTEFNIKNNTIKDKVSTEAGTTVSEILQKLTGINKPFNIPRFEQTRETLGNIYTSFKDGAKGLAQGTKDFFLKATSLADKFTLEPDAEIDENNYKTLIEDVLTENAKKVVLIKSDNKFINRVDPIVKAATIMVISKLIETQGGLNYQSNYLAEKNEELKSVDVKTSYGWDFSSMFSGKTNVSEDTTGSDAGDFGQIYPGEAQYNSNNNPIISDNSTEEGEGEETWKNSGRNSDGNPIAGGKKRTGGKTRIKVRKSKRKKNSHKAK